LELGNLLLWGRKLMIPGHGKSGCFPSSSLATTLTMREAPDAGGLGQRGRSLRLLELLLVPTDVRGIILLCGFVAAALFGLFAILTPPGDPIGWAYIGLAVVGYFFIQTRIVPAGLWLLVALGGAAVAMAGNASGWLETAIGVVLAAVSVAPLPPEYRTSPVANPRSSARVEVPPDRTSSAVEDPKPATSAHGALAPARAEITVSCLGRLRIQAAGREVSRFQREPRLEFLVSYLIARQLAGGHAAADRAAIADEIAPGIDPSSQKDRLRKQIHELAATDPVFKEIVHANRARVWIDLKRIDLDAIRLLSLAEKLRARSGMIDSRQAESIQAMLASTTGEFLSGFSDLEQDVTEARGSAGELVRELRSEIAGAFADLALALADYCNALDQPARAIPYLAGARRDRADRQDLARALVVAYLRTGQTAAADQVRHEADLKES